MGNQVRVAVLGAGNRGREIYGKNISRHPGEIMVTAIAEPVRERRELFAAEHHIDPERQFHSWQELLEKERQAEGLIVATMDHEHVEPTLAALDKGYAILLEKPIALTMDAISQIARKVKETNGLILVAHVLRYTDFYRELKRLLADGVIGAIRGVDHNENIGYYHFAHSYVRGNWRNTRTAAPIILAKSCHDMDLLFWLLNKKCQSLSAYASLSFFTEKNHPAGAAARCLQCPVEADCIYSARKIYLTETTEWPVSVISADHSFQGRYQALSDGPYGRCVFKCDNNVPELATINLNFEDDINVSFTMTAFSNSITRISRFLGTKGEIYADFEKGLIKIVRFNKSETIMNIPVPSGHGGGDAGLINHFIQILQGRKINDDSSTISASIESHLMALAAEEARNSNCVIALKHWREKLTANPVG